MVEHRRVIPKGGRGVRFPSQPVLRKSGVVWSSIAVSKTVDPGSNPGSSVLIINIERGIIMAQLEIIKHPLIQKALEVAEDRFRGKRRKDGRPTISHILDVLNIVVRSPHNFTVEEICAMILHDIIEDTDMTYSELIALFGRRIASLVWGLSKPEGMDTITYYIMLSHVVSPTLLALKLCDVVANLESVEGCDPTWVDEFKTKQRDYGFPLIEVLRMHGPEWSEHCNWIQDRMEKILGKKG